jgi:hypothetical protein
MRLDADRLARAVGAPVQAGADLTARTAGVHDLAPGVSTEQVTDVLVAALGGAADAEGIHHTN